MILVLLPALALARPTDGGMFSFDAADVVVSLDGPGGAVRVWYSVDGPNLTLLDDTDADGVPDFPALVAASAEAALVTFADTGFRPPIADGGRGGSDAMDVYLVDFAGNADGNYAAESCTSGAPRQCSGYFVMENDFAGYGYPDLDTAVRVLTSHELFHAVQAAYDADTPVWFAEGTAVWAEDLHDPENEDFLAYCDAYLSDAGRSLDKPPTGPVPTFAYATALWWWFLSNRHGDAFLVDLLEATESGDDVLADMEALEEAYGGNLSDDFTTFASWNLATGRLAGAADSYPFAAFIGPPRAASADAAIDDNNRFYPLATTYYRLEHGGGEVWFVAEADAPELRFALHPMDAEGDLLPGTHTFAATSTPLSLGDVPEGDHWLVGVNPTRAEDSTKLRVCLGADVSACAPAVADPPERESPGGCGCASVSTPAGAWLGLVALVAARRRQYR